MKLYHSPTSPYVRKVTALIAAAGIAGVDLIPVAGVGLSAAFFGDPLTAARLAPGDAQRIQRALEVWQLSGRPLSAHLAAGRADDDPLPLRILSLEPSDRSVLHARIAQRFEQMLAAGFVDEVRALRERGDLSPALPSIRAVGYRQAWRFLDGDISAEQFREQAIAATRQLAKRQLTWLRSIPQRQIYDCLKPLRIQVF